MRSPRVLGIAAVTVLVLALAGAVSAIGGFGAPARASSKSLLVWAVGDGPNQDNKRAAEVAAMIGGSKPADVLYLGDVYESGSKHEFDSYYNPTYGKFASITYPTPGNHELLSSPPLGGYDGYWKHKRPSVVGKHKQNLYATDLGMGWRLLDLTSSFVSEGSGVTGEDVKPGPQASDVVKFAQADLAAHKGTCYIAMMHRPRFSAGAHGDQDDLDAVWDALNGRTILLLQGHEHEYFRLNLDAVPAAANKLAGAQSIVAGTGGVRLSKTIDKSYPGLASSLVAPSSKDKSKKKYYGALRLELSSGQASWKFINLDGTTIDSGSVSCIPVTS
jgi:hypothetical protein